jgi:hypothetical protein
VNTLADDDRLHGTRGESEIRVTRRTKFLRFIICEVIALIMLLTSTMVGVREQHAHLRINPIVTAHTILAAVGVGIIPVIFYGPPPLQ